MTEKPATPQSLFALLETLEMPVTTHQHEAVFTVEQSQAINENIAGGHTKNLFLKDKKDNYFLIVAENHAKIPLNQVHKLIGTKSRLSFGSAEKLMELLGVAPGSVNAFAPINDDQNRVSVIIDAPLLDHEQINCHPLTNTMTTTISKPDLLRFLEYVDHKPQIIALSQRQDESEG